MITGILFIIFRFRSVQEVLAALDQDDDDIEEIFIEPPDAAVISEEDSADEDASGLVDNLSGRQLRSHAEVVYHHRQQLNDDDDEPDEDSSMSVTGRVIMIMTL